MEASGIGFHVTVYCDVVKRRGDRFGETKVSRKLPSSPDAFVSAIDQ